MGSGHGQFVVDANAQEVQRLVINRIGVGTLPFNTFVDRLCTEARALRTPIVHRV